MPPALSQATVIAKAIAVHGDTYDYTSVIYVNNDTKINITCKVHGIFAQLPSNHIKKKQGCPECKYSKSRFSTTDLLNKLCIYDELFTWDISKYKNMKTKIPFHCKTHNKDFEQRLNIY